MSQWHTLVDRLKQSKVDFVIAPDTRFAGLPGEQATFFIRDPSGNALEFKAFDDENRIFAR
jgi:extradiol dioxygenase family protein